MPRDATATDKITPTDLTRIAERGSDPEWLSDPRATASSRSNLGMAAAAWSGLSALADDLDVARRTTLADTDLSDLGRAKRLRSKAESARKAVREHAGQVDAVARTIAALKADALKDDGSALASLAPLVAVIWQQLPADPLEVESLYRQAAEEGDATVVRAIEALPLTHRGRIAPDRLGQLREDRALAVDDAALTGELRDLTVAERDLRRLRRYTEQGIEDLEAEVARLSGGRGPRVADPVADTAAGAVGDEGEAA